MGSDSSIKRKPFLIYAILLIATGIALGAFGAHGLDGLVKEGKLDLKNLASWKTGVLYQLLMAGGLILMIMLEKNYRLNSLKTSLIILSIGVSLFAFSIYILVLNHLWNIDMVKYAMIPLTPIGGIFMITSWVLLLLNILKHKK
ncbi:hypothetical protein CRYO30217_00987 [Parvicella tangerina]|uniref:DUF423 domain-containing protein n=2 Tax=Parvicella tangerina TaxID=2829795 RepID=A0A916N9S7_9FLAO|nr:hypothetical protein CRYO30217_00987 [Parvicella tangerina]